MSDEKDKVNKIIESINRNRQPGTFERYNNDIFHYLREKFPDESESAICEAAAFVSNRSVILVNDLLIENNKYRRRIIERKGD